MKLRGRHGWVILGPTEARVARFLEDATRHGRVTFASVELAARLDLSRSEFYRVTARLRELGLFGVENDQGGTIGGRRYWRTATPSPESGLDPVRHRLAWGRVRAWLRARRAEILARLRPLQVRAVSPSSFSGAPRPMAGPVAVPPAAAGPPITLRSALLKYAPALAAEWRIS